MEKLTCTFYGTEGFSDCYRTSEQVMSPAFWEWETANRGSGLKRKLLSPTRKNYDLCRTPMRSANHHSKRSRAKQFEMQG